jgi:hypothetical protein
MLHEKCLEVGNFLIDLVDRRHSVVAIQKPLNLEVLLFLGVVVLVGRTAVESRSAAVDRVN